MQEYVDFLGRQDPYDRLDGDDLATLGRSVEVEYFAAGSTIVAAEEPQLDHLYVVRTGVVNVVDRSAVVDSLREGDTFGHISLLSGLPPPLSVVAATDTLCYRLPDPRHLLKHPERLTFAHYNSLVARPRLLAGAHDYALREVREFMRQPSWCTAATTVRAAAQQMSREHLSCVVYPFEGGLGIMTDSDCRRHVATGEVPIDAPVHEAGSAPALTVPDTTTAGTALLQMVHHGVHHLVVCDDAGRPVGIVRAVDVGSADVRDPLVTRSAINNARSLEELARATQQLIPTVMELQAASIPALRVGALLGAMTEAVLAKCIDLSPFFHPTDSPYPVLTSWLVLGSLARREPLPWSDVDTGLVWTAGTTATPDPRSIQAAAEDVIRSFEHCGLRRCVDGANASNPLFNRSREAWLASAGHWVAHPDKDGALLLPSIVADSRPVTGLDLGASLTQSISTQARTRTFLQAMLNESLAKRPPTGFVRDFVVEASGRHRGQLNLKRRGLQPIVALGRWISITLGEAVDSTTDRLRAGVAAGILTRDEGETLEGAFEQMYELLFDHEIAALTSGTPVSTYLRPQDLDTLARRHLRESFRATAKVQTRLEAEWVSRLG